MVWAVVVIGFDGVGYGSSIGFDGVGYGSCIVFDGVSCFTNWV